MKTQLTVWSPLISIILAAGIIVAATIFTVAAHGKGGISPLVPPHANFRGKSFEEWSVLQTQFAIADGLGTGGIDDTVGRVRLLPGAFFGGEVEFDITLPPGTPFVQAPWFVFGESYDNAESDDPVAAAEFIEFLFATTEIETVLDGKVLLDGNGAELERFQFGPTYYDEPITYLVPQPRGEDLNATAALWVTGIGSVYHPLPVGEHTLVVTVENEFFGGFEFTYHITVSK